MNTPTAKPMTMLLAEDDASIANLWRKILEKNGFEVTWKNHGDAALDAMNKEKFDVILLDLYLPGTNGFQILAAKVTTINNSTPVYVFTSSPKYEDLAHARELGAKETFLKYLVSPKAVVAQLVTALS